MAHTSSTTQSRKNPIPQRRRRRRRPRPWSDLPCDLVEQISDRLAILDLVSFRGTCREWRRFASSSKAETVFLELLSRGNQEQPLFLHYSKDEYPNCNLYDPCSKKLYTKLDIPEFGQGVECIASKGGWLLLYGKSDRSIFFFCPFSRARIDLPKLPGVGGKIIDESLVFHRIATFSSPPTSPDCIVCVCTQTIIPPNSDAYCGIFAVDVSDGYCEIFAVDVLWRGQIEWSFSHELLHLDYAISCEDKVRSAIIGKESIYFLSISMKGMSLTLGIPWKKTYFSFETGEDTIVLDCGFRVTPSRAYFSCNEGLDKGILGLKDTDSLSICGTELQGDDPSSGNIKSIFYEEIKGVGDEEEEEKGIMAEQNLSPIGKEHKGVWIQPRFFQLPSNYKWSTYRWPNYTSRCRSSDSGSSSESSSGSG